MSHSVQPHLIGLPYELQLSILRFLGPLDIESIEKTCRQMYFAASDKRLWIDVLKDICEENSVFLATYSFEDMSLEELRLSATRPDRFMLLLEKWEPGEPLHHRHGRCFYPDRGALEIFDIYLVPGGRYLFVFYTGKVLLFDLLHHWYTDPVASVDVINSMYVVCSTSDGLGLRVVLLGDNDDQSEFKIFDIYPLCPKPEFINIATLNHPGEIDLRVLSICGDFIVFIDDRTVKIWNFVTHKATLWKVTEQFDQVIATDTTILLISKNGTGSIWLIPDLIFEPDALHLQDAEILHPCTRIRLYSHLSHAYRVEIAGPCDWYTGAKTKHNRLIDFTARIRNTTSTNDADAWIWTLSRIHINPNNVPDEDHSAHTSSLIQQYYLEPCGDVFDIDTYRVCNSKIFALWFERSRVPADPEDPDPDPEDQPWTGQTKLHVGASGLAVSHETGKQYIMMENKSLETGEFSFCPVAARICYAESNSLVYVIDFLDCY